MEGRKTDERGLMRCHSNRAKVLITCLVSFIAVPIKFILHLSHYHRCLLLPDFPMDDVDTESAYTLWKEVGIS